MRRASPISLIVASGVCALALGAHSIVRADDRGPAFTVGILRRDAIVVPFANYDGKKWHADWPAARDVIDVPVDVRAVPRRWWGDAGPREEWQAWVDDAAPQTLTVRQPDWFPAFCLRAIGLRTDYHSRQRVPPLTTRPFPTDGLAVSPPQPIERIRVLGPADPLSAQLAPAVLETFNQTERKIDRQQHHPIHQKDREKTAPVIEAIYASADAHLVYVEAAREYHEEDDPMACRVTAFGGGWFARGGDRRYAPLQTYVTVLNCDRDGASYMLPLGIVRLSDRTYWLSQFSGWDGMHFEVDEIEPKKVTTIVDRFGGGCS
jgi:hypothetical protein